MAIRYSYIRYVMDLLEEDLLNSEVISKMSSQDHTMTDAQLADRLSCLNDVNDVNDTHYLTMPSPRGEVVSESPQTSSNHPSSDSDSSYSTSDSSNSDSDSSTSDSDSSTSDSDHPTPNVRSINNTRRNVPQNKPPQRKAFGRKRKGRGGSHTIPPMSLEMYRHVKEKSKLYIDPKFMIILDACNIAMSHGVDHFSTKGICIARDHFKALGLRVIAFMPAYYVNRMDGRIVSE